MALSSTRGPLSGLDSSPRNAKGKEERACDS